MNTLEKIIMYEEGQLSEDEFVELFAELISTGIVWELQGSYGRMAKALIDQGIVSANGEIL